MEWAIYLQLLGCVNYARLSKREKDNCVFQRVSAGQLWKALGVDAGQSSGSAGERQQSKGVERGQLQGAGGKQNKGKKGRQEQVGRRALARG